ncbi:hypothetical protein QG37_08358 [Candidozyma auris]|uniref:Uncharacterized protein n=1 Tax=Candidozyma auris TaxID=498019 RepID=A0A0L0NMQ6_CANAR|nr:hypothetical protein QG37_08358 [[Candida] auris]
MLPVLEKVPTESKLKLVITLAFKELKARSPRLMMEPEAMVTEAAKPLVDVT